MKKTFGIYALIGVLILSTALGGCFRKGAAPKFVTLNFYGLDEPSVFSSIISDYTAKNPGVSIKYKQFANNQAFENLVVNEIAEGAGPDIFYVHNTWLPRHSKKLVALESDTFTPRQFTDNYVKVASDDFIQPDPSDGNSKIYALPLFVDTLAVFYNKKLFDQNLPERGKPALNWNLLLDDAQKFRKLSKDDKLERGQVALGRADNINLAPDILYNLFLQAGETFYDTAFSRIQLGQPAQKYFDYYLSFAVPANKNYSWSTDLTAAVKSKSELEPFMAGKVAAIFGYSDTYSKLKSELKSAGKVFSDEISLNDVGVAPVPQISNDSSNHKVFASYYGVGVSRNSKNPVEAWNFIRYLGSKSPSESYYKKTSRPTARRDLIEAQRREPITEVFISQLGYAASIRIFSANDFADALRAAITAANSGQTSRSALDQAKENMNTLFKTEAPGGLYPKVIKKK